MAPLLRRALRRRVGAGAPPLRASAPAAPPGAAHAAEAPAALQTLLPLLLLFLQLLQLRLCRHGRHAAPPPPPLPSASRAKGLKVEWGAGRRRLEGGCAPSFSPCPTQKTCCHAMHQRIRVLLACSTTSPSNEVGQGGGAVSTAAAQAWLLQHLRSRWRQSARPAAVPPAPRPAFRVDGSRSGGEQQQ